MSMRYSVAQQVAYPEAFNYPNLPDESDLVYVTYEDYERICNRSVGEEFIVNGDGSVVIIPAMQMSDDELITQAMVGVQRALQHAIDNKAVDLGFSGGNALMLYAGFENAFKPLAQKFGAWEAQVWVEASAYKAEVLAGKKPMVMPDEAVAMMPPYPEG
jgi:hypothetical protein